MYPTRGLPGTRRNGDSTGRTQKVQRGRRKASFVRENRSHRGRHMNCVKGVGINAPQAAGLVTHYARVRAWSHRSQLQGKMGTMASKHWVFRNHLRVGDAVSAGIGFIPRKPNSVALGRPGSRDIGQMMCGMKTGLLEIGRPWMPHQRGKRRRWMLIKTLLWGLCLACHCPHFADEETKVQEGLEMHLMSPNRKSRARTSSRGL